MSGCIKHANISHNKAMTKQEAIVQAQAILAKADEPVKMRIVGEGTKNRLEVLAYNHARQSTLRTIRKAHQEEFDAILAEKMESCVAEKTELLQKEASNGSDKATAILQESGIEIA